MFIVVATNAKILHYACKQSVHGVVECLKVVTRDNSDRVARFAFDFAKRHGRKKVTTIHKANIM